MTDVVCGICGRGYEYSQGALTRTLTVNVECAKSACRPCFQAWLKESNLPEPPTCSGCGKYFRVDLYEVFCQPVWDCRFCDKSFCENCVNDSHTYACAEGRTNHDFV